MRNVLNGHGAVNGAGPAAITLDNLTISYDRKPAVHHLNGAFAAGSLTAVAGPNGAGKSTLLKALAGILHADEGQIQIANGWSPVGYLPQVAELERDIPLTVLEIVSSGFWKQCGSFHAISRRERQLALDALDLVGLGQLEHRTLASLSVGQFQRMLFARLIVQNTPLILLDEPFAAVDASTLERLLDLVLGWHRDGRTVICVLHDLDLIRHVFPSCLLLARECVAWGSPAEVLRPEKLAAAGNFHGVWPLHAELCLQ